MLERRLNYFSVLLIENDIIKSLSYEKVSESMQPKNVGNKVLLRYVTIIIFSGSAAERGLWPHSRGFLITHNNAPQSVGFLWTSDQLVAETST
jgi:hypothetical protein